MRPQAGTNQAAVGGPRWRCAGYGAVAASHWICREYATGERGRMRSGESLTAAAPSCATVTQVLQVLACGAPGSCVYACATAENWAATSVSASRSAGRRWVVSVVDFTRAL